MTLGTKLANYRRIAGLTQQQLGEHLNVSPQAISKWEKDLSEPSLATLQILAELYKVSVDELLDLNSGFHMPATEDAEESEGTEEPEQSTASPSSDAPTPTPAPFVLPTTVGFCKKCGVTVTDKNLGQSSPEVLCRRCKDLEEDEKIRAERRKEQKKQENRYALRKRRTWGFVIAALATILFVTVNIAAIISDYKSGLLATAILLPYAIFAFIFSMFFDCAPRNVVEYFFDKTIQWPGLIFTWDLDGIRWLIGMKLLFWFLGLLFGILMGIIGIFVGLICAPFSFPFTLGKVQRAIQSGDDPEEVLP